MEHPAPDIPAALRQRYLAAIHAMQSGVAARMALGHGNETTPKHLRVGVNSALVDTAALARLLLSKGVFTAEEYWTAVVEGMETEVAMYERGLGARLA